MRDRRPVFFAMTVSSLAVLATAVTAGRAVAAGPSGFASTLSAGQEPQLKSSRPLQSVRPERLGDNVVVFDSTRARRKNRNVL